MMRRVSIIGLMTTLLVAACATKPPTDPLSVSVETGALHGERADESVVFRGVPYAAPPVGALRWRAPQPAMTWQGTRDATQFGADCMQNRMANDLGAGAGPISEDCLFLNVWTPVSRSTSKLPVMVWIHGGGFVGGSGSASITDGSELAARGIVVVTFNYRLGRFGFFAHPELTQEVGEGFNGNWGLLDQIAALEWVKRNIGAFGGDPTNVTIFGESAGGESVNRLMASPVTVGLFHKAITASGGGRDVWPNLNEAEKKGVAFGQSAGVADLAALRALPAKSVLGGMTLMTKDDARYSGPVTDGKLIVEPADIAFKEGRAAKVPYIVGANSDELGAIPAGMRKMANNIMAGPIRAELQSVAAAYGSPSAMERRIAGDVTFVEPARAMAVRHASSGNPTYLYSFGYVAEKLRTPDTGAGHASDVPYQFDALSPAIPARPSEDEAMARQVASYWTNFAKKGDPNSPDLPVWPTVDPERPLMLLMGVTETQAISANPPEILAIARARD